MRAGKRVECEHGRLKREPLQLPARRQRLAGQIEHDASAVDVRAIAGCRWSTPASVLTVVEMGVHARPACALLAGDPAQRCTPAAAGWQHGLQLRTDENCIVSSNVRALTSGTKCHDN